MANRGWVGIPIEPTGGGWVSPLFDHRGWDSIPILGHFRVVCNDRAEKYIRRSAIVSQSHSATVKEAPLKKEEEEEESVKEEKVGNKTYTSLILEAAMEFIGNSFVFFFVFRLYCDGSFGHLLFPLFLLSFLPYGFHIHYLFAASYLRFADVDVV